MSDKIYTEIEVTLSVAQTLIDAAITTSIKEDDEGYHYTAMRTIQDARTLLPALGKYEADCAERLACLYDLYSKHADDKEDLEPIEAA